MIFPVRCEGDEVLKYIFPTMQREVQKVIDKAKELEKIEKIIIFGSSVTLNCGIGSDLDIAVVAPEIEDEDDFLLLVRPIRRALNVDADIIHYNTIHSELLKHEIDTKGVDVYVSKI